MKDFINYISDPVYSFTIVMLLFVLMIRYVEAFASKTVGIALMVIFIITNIYLFSDETFRVNFGMTTDNVPIIFQ